ncbi:hypothetical protein BDN71DRAFT_1436227 [Pleurotus eryngii]|uniref:Uncharacterized protein n=1 Tax=Pleurotus eryngii TaxID=5323 RepID=A0A9P6DA41_PLEER|nr:hypothetical protein BDN71DRAFT_1436227 [Pleurotus eryngii]
MTDKFKPQDLLFNQIQLLKSFIEVVMKKLSDERINFVINHTECTAKCETYSTWFHDRVTPRVNMLVKSAMHECSFHPQSVLAMQELDDFPLANIPVNACLTSVAVEMFGDVIISGDILIDKVITANLKTLLVYNVSCMGKAYIHAGSVVDKKVELMNNVLKEVEENIVKLKEAVCHAMKQPQNNFDTPVHSQKPKANENGHSGGGLQEGLQDPYRASGDGRQDGSHLYVAVHCYAPGALKNCPTEAKHHAYTKFLEEGDLGVEIMSKLSFKQLTILLSFVGGRPSNWNTCVHESK